MKKPKMSPTMAALLSEEHWAIPEETRKKMMYDYLNRTTPCHACKHVELGVRFLSGNLYYKCSENLAPREGCLLFELDESSVIIDDGIAGLQKEKEETK